MDCDWDNGETGWNCMRMAGSFFEGLQEAYPDKYNKLVNARPEMDGHLAFFTIVFDRRTE